MNKHIFLAFLFLFGWKDAISNPDSISLFKGIFLAAEAAEDGEIAFEFALKIAELYGSAYPDSGLIWVKQAYEISVARKEINLQKKSLVARCRFEFWNQQFENSVITAQKAEELLELHPNDELRLPLLYRLAEGYEYTNRHQQGSETYEKCYDLAEKLKDAVMLSRLNIKMGNLRQVNGDFEQALSFYKKAALKLDRNEPEQLLSYFKALHEYYDLALKKQELVSPKMLEEICQNIIKESKQIAKNTNATIFSALFADLRIRCLLRKGSEEEWNAIPLSPISELEKLTTNPTKLQQQLDLFSEVALRQNRFKEATNYNKRSQMLAEVSKNLALKIRSKDLSKQIAEKQKDYKTAYEAAEMLVIFEKKLAEKERIQSIQELETKLLREEQEQRIILLNERKRALESRSFFFTISSIGFAVISFLAVWFFYQSKIRNQIIFKQKEQLEELNLTKDRIFSIIGHDLRKPAIAFRGISKKVNYLLKKQAYQSLEKLGNEIEKDAMSLNQLTDNLLNWALTQKDMLPYQPQKISLQEVIEDNFLTYKNIADQKNIELRSNISEGLSVVADENALRTILRNLTDNALKFTHSGGEVEINAVTHEKKIELEIRDTGIGMSEEKARELFTFKKNNSTQGTAGEKGTGLGMHLVRELIELNKGTIGVSSKPGEGTVFRVTLPRA